MLLPCSVLLLLTTVGGTRLPLEVFEITPTSTAEKHKSLEYTVFDAKDVAAAVAAETGAATGATVAATSTSSSSSSSSSTVRPTPEQLTVVSISTADQEQELLAESRRRARQMLQKQQQHRSNSKHGRGDKDVRILYQVGVSKRVQLPPPNSSRPRISSRVQLMALANYQRCSCNMFLLIYAKTNNNNDNNKPLAMAGCIIQATTSADTCSTGCHL